MWFQRQAFIRMLHPSMYVFKKVFILKNFWRKQREIYWKSTCKKFVPSDPTNSSSRSKYSDLVPDRTCLPGCSLPSLVNIVTVCQQMVVSQHFSGMNMTNFLEFVMLVICSLGASLWIIFIGGTCENGIWLNTNFVLCFQGIILRTKVCLASFHFRWKASKTSMKAWKQQLPRVKLRLSQMIQISNQGKRLERQSDVRCG